MKTKNEAKLKMYQAVLTHCNNYSDVTSSVQAFNDALAAFKNKVDAITTTAGLEAKVLTGITMNKAETRKLLSEQALVIAAAIYALGSSRKNEDLREQGNFSPSDLSGLRENELIIICDNIANMANKYATELVVYGITPAVYDTYTNTLTDYRRAVPGSRFAVTQRSSYSTELKTLFVEADNILKREVDKIAKQFQSPYPRFHNGYVKSREIIDMPASTTEIAGVVLDTAKVAISGVTVQIIGSKNVDARDMTDKDGKYKLPVPPGVYSVSFSKYGFASKTLNDVEATLGNSSKLNTTLAA